MKKEKTDLIHLLSFKLISIDDIRSIKHFTCDNESMNNFLYYEAYPSHIERSASTTLVFMDNQLVGYYTLKHVYLGIEPWIKNSRYNFALDISRIAVSKEFHNRGIGTTIIKHILMTAYQVNERFITLDSLKELWQWYRDKFNFSHMFDDDLENEEPVVTMIADLYDPELVQRYFEE